MWPFKKKYDLEKDNLSIDFNFYTMKYEVRQGDKIIPIEELNDKTKAIYQEKKNEYMKKQVERCRKLNRLGYEFACFQTFSNKEGTMCKEAEKILLPLVEEENVLIGIHRVGEKVNDDEIDKMLSDGVIMTGHGYNVQNINGPALELNFGCYYDNKTILKEVMFAHGYKGSKGSIIIRIPDEDLKGNIYVKNELGNYCINPKYIVGYFEVDENYNVLSVKKPKKEEKQSFSYKYNGEQLNFAETEQNTINKTM